MIQDLEDAPATSFKQGFDVLCAQHQHFEALDIAW
jgi:hypothetical protein